MALLNKWEQLDTWKKRLGILAGILSATVALVAPLWAGAKVLATDAEVDAKIAKVQLKFDDYAAQQQLKDRQQSIREARWRLEDIEYRLLDPQLPDVQRAALEQSRKELLRRISCIQAAQELCE